MKTIRNIIASIKHRIIKIFGSSDADSPTDLFDDGYYKFVWGVKSQDDFSDNPPCLYSLNDIDICFDKHLGEYILSIETAYWFENAQQEIEFLEKLLNQFTAFMNENGYDTNFAPIFWMCQPEIAPVADTLPELYTNFRMFVAAYKTIRMEMNNERT